MPKRHPQPKYRHVFVLGAVTAALLVAGCGDSGTSSTQADGSATVMTTTTDTTSTTDRTPGTEARSATVYFMNDAGTGLVVEQHTVDASSPLRAALVALADGPEAADGVRALPAGTQIIGTDVRGGAAYVNLNSAFLDGYPSGGSTAEISVLGPLVFTATQAAGVERVFVTVDGQATAPAGSQFDWTRGFTRTDFPDLSISGG